MKYKTVFIDENIRSSALIKLNISSKRKILSKILVSLSINYYGIIII